MARFVKFAGAGPYVPAHFVLDGAAGTYLSTEDINLLDADYAHMIQSQPWQATNGTLTDLGAQSDGFGAVRLDVTTPGALFRGFTGQPLDTGDMTASIDIDNEQASDRDARIVLIGSNNTGNGVILTLPPGVSRLPANVSMSGGTLTEYRIQFTDSIAGDSFVCSKAQLESGDNSSPTFVPSLRIAGTLFEEKDDAALPIVFAADGTPLTVGAGFTGNAVFYRRFDGADNTAPNVANMNPRDIGLSAGAVPDGTTWVDSVTGRVWTSNGLVTFVEDVFGDAVAVPNTGFPSNPFIVKNPPAMPDILDNNFWVVGSGWVGEGFTATMHDGVDATGPVVAEFDAADIGI